MSGLAASDAEAPPSLDPLAPLRTAGARAFDPPAYAFVESLLARARALGGVAGARLATRAAARAEALAREVEEAKARARGAVAPLGEESARFAETIEAGHVVRALRFAKARAVAPLLRRPEDAEWIARLLAEARARGLSIAAHSRTPGALGAALYESSRSELAAILAALDAEAMIPVGTGPYNPLAIAARALAALSARAPAYLAALIAQLDEISPLLSLPAPPPERTSPSPVRRPRARSKPPTA
jgi:hypothetical protein